MAVSATQTSWSRRRAGRPIWKWVGTYVWETGDGHDEQELTINNLNGIVEAVTINASTLTTAPTLTLNLTDAHSGVACSLTALAVGTVHYKDADDFKPIPIAGELTIGIDPSADIAGTAQTLTVIVAIKGE